ncbi:hypothetical protein [Blautia sp.]|uniref:hypothetical protein n=1 Tax=Blautia sp. TaxID=1955243 RepID=UPI0035222CA3
MPAAEYICETPVSNPAPGTYTATVQTLELRAGHCQRIYYTSGWKRTYQKDSAVVYRADYF